MPGDSADILQLPLCGVVGGDGLERVLAQVPLPLNDLQGHGQVPVLVEEDMVAQEGEIDLPDLLEQLEGQTTGTWSRHQRLGQTWVQSHPSRLDLHICEMGPQDLVHVAIGRQWLRALAPDSDTSGFRLLAMRPWTCHLNSRNPFFLQNESTETLSPGLRCALSCEAINKLIYVGGLEQCLKNSKLSPPTEDC